MKKIIAVLLTLVFCMGGLAGCKSDAQQDGASTVTMKDGETVQTVVDKIADEIGVQMPAELDDAVLKDMFHIDAQEDAEEYYGLYAMTMTSADNIVAVKAKPGKKDAVVEALNTRLKEVQDSFAQYLPDQSDKAKKGQVIEKGDYVFLLILGQDMDTFDADMERAVEIVNEAF